MRKVDGSPGTAHAMYCGALATFNTESSPPTSPLGVAVAQESFGQFAVHGYVLSELGSWRSRFPRARLGLGWNRMYPLCPF